MRDLHTAAPHSRLHIIGDAGHSMTELPIAAKLKAIMNGPASTRRTQLNRSWKIGLSDFASSLKA